MRDVEIDTEGERPYECFACGSIVITEDHPGNCPDCSGPMRNRQTPLE